MLHGTTPRRDFGLGGGAKRLPERGIERRNRQWCSGEIRGWTVDGLLPKASSLAQRGSPSWCVQQAARRRDGSRELMDPEARVSRSYTEKWHAGRWNADQAT